MIIVPSNKVLLLGWESVSESREKGFLISNLLPGWRGLGKQQLSLFL